MRYGPDTADVRNLRPAKPSAGLTPALQLNILNELRYRKSEIELGISAYR